MLRSTSYTRGANHVQAVVVLCSIFSSPLPVPRSWKSEIRESGLGRTAIPPKLVMLRHSHQKTPSSDFWNFLDALHQCRRHTVIYRLLPLVTFPCDLGDGGTQSWSLDSSFHYTDAVRGKPPSHPRCDLLHSTSPFTAESLSFFRRLILSL